MSQSVGVEVLIVSYDSADTLARCLSSIESIMPGTPIAIREHGSDCTALDRLRTLAANHPAPTRIDVDTSNPGFGAGCNALAARSTADHIVFLNPDTEMVAWPWMEDSPPLRTIVGPQMVGERDGDHSGKSFRVRDEIARSWLRRRGRRPDGFGFVSGAALMIDRRSFVDIGGFDEGYFLFYEDIDLCLRANRHGIATTLDHRWRVEHSGAHSTRSRFGQALTWSYESANRFHGSNGSLVGYRLYVVADSLVRAFVSIALLRGSAASAYLRLAGRASTDLAVTGRRALSAATRPRPAG